MERRPDPEEPVFMLLARDVTAAAVILNWAARRESLILQALKPEEDKALVESARALAQLMSLVCATP